LDLEGNDLTVLVIRALCQRAMNAISAISKGTPHEWDWKTSDITAAAKNLALEFEMDIDPERITSKRAGRVLGSMRLARNRDRLERLRRHNESNIKNDLRNPYSVRRLSSLATGILSRGVAGETAQTVARASERLRARGFANAADGLSREDTRSRAQVLFLQRCTFRFDPRTLFLLKTSECLTRRTISWLIFAKSAAAIKCNTS